MECSKSLDQNKNGLQIFIGVYFLLLLRPHSCVFLLMNGNVMSMMYANVLGRRTVLLALDKVCYMYKVLDGRMSRTIAQTLACDHHEADTHILFHASYIAEIEEGTPKIAVRSSDTDVFVLLLHHEPKLNASVIMDVGVASSNTRRSIDISLFAKTLGTKVCDALPAFHAFTGCDYSAAFIRKGKIRPFRVMVKHDKYLVAFSQLGSSSEVQKDVADTLTEFV